MKTILKRSLLALGYEVKKVRQQPDRLTEIDESISIKKVHYACGDKYREGWLNLDLYKQIENNVVPVDLTNRHPFQDNFFEWGFCEDFLEHLTQADSLIFLSEVYRTFKPGGVCRLAFPGIDGQVAVGPAFSDYDSAKKIKDHYYERYGHVHLYSKDEFEKICIHIGFHKVEFTSYHISMHDELKGLETRDHVKHYYTYVEISK